LPGLGNFIRDQWISNRNTLSLLWVEILFLKLPKYSGKRVKKERQYDRSPSIATNADKKAFNNSAMFQKVFIVIQSEIVIRRIPVFFFDKQQRA